MDIIIVGLIIIAGVGVSGLLFCLFCMFSIKQYHDNLEEE